MVCFFVILSIVQTRDKILLYESSFSIGSDSENSIAFDLLDRPMVKVTEQLLFMQQKKHSSDKNITINKTTTDQQSDVPIKFYILDTPDIRTILNQQRRAVYSSSSGGKNKNLTAEAVASEYYKNNINEKSAEMWLHRGFERLTANRTLNPKETDVYIVGGFFHLFSSGRVKIQSNRPSKRKRRKTKHNDNDDGNHTDKNALLSSSFSWEAMVTRLYQNVIIDSSKPHLILIPTWNSGASRRIGLHSLVKSLRFSGVSDADIGLSVLNGIYIGNLSDIYPISSLFLTL